MTIHSIEHLEPRRLLATIVVTDLNDDTIGNGQVTLREALIAAETDSSVDGSAAGAGADTILFDPSLTALGSAATTLNEFDSGLDSSEFGPAAFIISTDVSIVGPFGDNGISIQRLPNHLGSFRLFHVRAGASLTLQNVSLLHGRATGGNGNGGGGAGLGGAIFNQGTLNIFGCSLIGNSATGGDGGIVGINGLLGGGGGVGSGASNEIGGGPNGGVAGQPGGFGGGGGGGENTPSQIGGDGGFGGGGGSGFGGAGNGGFGGGGGASLAGGGSPGYLAGFGAGTSTDNSLHSGGGAGMGGAIFNESGVVNLINSTLAQNTAQGGTRGGPNANHGGAAGGGFFSRNGAVTIRNCTFVSNTLISPGGTSGAGGVHIYSDGPGAEAALDMHNTIITASTGDDFSAAFAVGSVTPNITGATNLIRFEEGAPPDFAIPQTDAQLRELDAYGGPTRSYLPLETSPVIDAGNDAAVTGLLTDQRGFIRIIGDSVDIGALEFDSVPLNPTAQSEEVTRGIAQPVTINVLANDTDPLQRPLSVTLEVPPAVGTAVVNPDNTVTYTPNPGFNGEDGFVYRANVAAGGSSFANVIVTPTGAGFDQDPFNPGQQALFIGGTSGNDIVQIKRKKSQIQVFINRVPQGDPFDMTASSIIIDGGLGNDKISTGPLKTVRAIIYGGAGNDTLKGTALSDILVGGQDNDTINAGLGNDLVIGSGESDALKGLGGDDILIAGPTLFDAHTPAEQATLIDILATWNSGADYAARVAAITSPPRLVELFDDNARDSLLGASGADVFAANVSAGTVLDVLKGVKPDETVIAVAAGGG